MAALEGNEPNVIHDELIRTCIQLDGPAENLEEKRRQTDFREAESLSFSFRNIQKIENLRALNSLTKLQLDNNKIKKIENIDHLVNLTWLDLSFNEITNIEGLSTLTNLTDLSLHSNQISVIENLETLVDLNVFSIGNNNLRQMENIMYLRQFSDLKLVNLAGNPFCLDPEYYNYVLSHIKALKYLDYRLVDKAHVQAAREQYQDQMIELEDQDLKKEEAEAVAKKTAENEALMAAANMGGVESLFEDMLREDVEYQKLKTVKGLTDITDFRDKYIVATEDFKTNMLEVHEQKKDERKLWESVTEKACADKDYAARMIITDYEKKKKHAFRDVRDDPSRAEQLLSEPTNRNMQMRDELMELEMQTVEIVSELNQEFERNYSELVDNSKALYSTYFGQIRDLENVYFDQVTVVALGLLEDYAQGKLNPEEFSDEESRAMLADKDTLMNSIQASHDAHTSKIDGLEDTLVQSELRRFNDLVVRDKEWEHKRNRDRIAEIYNLIDRNKAEIDEMMIQEEIEQ